MKIFWSSMPGPELGAGVQLGGEGNVYMELWQATPKWGTPCGQLHLVCSRSPGILFPMLSPPFYTCPALSSCGLTSCLPLSVIGSPHAWGARFDRAPSSGPSALVLAVLTSGPLFVLFPRPACPSLLLFTCQTAAHKSSPSSSVTPSGRPFLNPPPGLN